MNFRSPVVVDRLDRQSLYDICLVTVRREQIEAIMPALAASVVPLIAFFHNHADGSESLARRIGLARTVIAFPGAGGAVGADGVLRYALIAEQPTMIGIPLGFDARPRALRDVLRRSGLRVTLVRDPDAWLRRHAVMVGALTGALGSAVATLQRSSDHATEFPTSSAPSVRVFALWMRHAWPPLPSRCG